ncbi:MAG TPA: hypothetical protein VFT64_10905 [Rickettsiales bacterium]|nr:hypothetical protein [Rickettsiales bacterium]
MTPNRSTSGEMTFVPSQWVGRDGVPLESEEKISTLNNNLAEVYEVCQHAFVEAVQMGCSEDFMRIVLRNMIDSLKRNSIG